MTRKYIDKKTALHFKLVQKSVKGVHDDADSEAKRIFVPMNKASVHLVVKRFVSDMTYRIC